MSITLPAEFEERMKALLGSEYSDFLEAYGESNYHSLRLKDASFVMPEGMRESFKLRPVPWCKTGFYYDEESRPGRHPYHHAGMYYIQEPSAMLVGEVADAKPGMKVLDLCAAPGGKTSHLAGMMQGEGVLVANEVVPNRAKILSQNVERMGIKNCIVTSEYPDKLARNMSAYFDLIVVDTPCSGEGMFRRDEIARTEWSPENVTMCAKRGQGILDEADKMLKMGGRLVYSTCTFAVDEDEKAVTEFIKSHPYYSIEKIELQKSDGAKDSDGWPSPGRCEWSDGSVSGIDNTYRLWPHLLHGEGHYVAVLRKDGEAAIIKSRPVKKSGDNALSSAVKLYEEWANGNLKVNLSGEYRLFGDNLYLMPEGAPNIERLKVERAGLHLGEIKKNRFEPAHALAMALTPDDVKESYDIKVSADGDVEALKYLRGESLNTNLTVNGWILITVDNCSIGWGKISGGVIKNHYPKGLRIKM